MTNALQVSVIVIYIYFFVQFPGTFKMWGFTVDSAKKTKTK